MIFLLFSSSTSSQLNLNSSAMLCSLDQIRRNYIYRFVSNIPYIHRADCRALSEHLSSHVTSLNLLYIQFHKYRRHHHRIENRHSAVFRLFTRYDDDDEILAPLSRISALSLALAYIHTMRDQSETESIA